MVIDGAFTLDGLTADIRVELRLNNLAAFPRVLEATGVTIGSGMESTSTMRCPTRSTCVVPWAWTFPEGVIR